MKFNERNSDKIAALATIGLVLLRPYSSLNRFRRAAQPMAQEHARWSHGGSDAGQVAGSGNIYEAPSVANRSCAIYVNGARALIEHRIIDRRGEARWVLTRSQTHFDDSGGLRRPSRTIGAVLLLAGRQ